MTTTKFRNLIHEFILYLNGEFHVDKNCRAQKRVEKIRRQHEANNCSNTLN